MPIRTGKNGFSQPHIHGRVAITAPQQHVICLVSTQCDISQPHVYGHVVITAPQQHAICLVST